MRMRSIVTEKGDRVHAMTDVSAGTEREEELDHAPEGRGSAPRSNLLSKATEGRIVRGTRCKPTHLLVCSFKNITMVTPYSSRYCSP